MKSARILSILLAFLFISASADEKSGPGRTTISSFEGGTVYYVNELVTGKRTKRAQWTLQTKKGPVVVTKTPWGFLLKGSNVDVKLETGMGGLKVADAKREISIKSEFGGKVNVKFYNNDLTFEEVGLNGVSVSGSRGTLKVEKDLPNIKMTSRAGTTTFAKRIDGYKGEGTPLNRHPYTFRALLFERNGVGVMVDLLPYHHEAMRGILDWSRVKTI